VGLFDAWFKQKDNDNEERGMVNYSPGSSGMIYSMFGTTTVVTEEQAMKIPSVVACVELITGSIAQLPIYLYKENDKGEVEKVPNDRRVFLLNNEPNQFLNGYNFKKRLAKDYLFYGTSYTKKETERNNILELHPFDMRHVQVTKYLIDGYKYEADIRLMTIGNDGKRKQYPFHPHELIMILKDSEDGITSTGVLEAGADILQLALNESEYTSNILKNGALPIGVVQTMNRLSETALKRLRAGWESLYSGSRNSGKTVVLEEGLDYKPISLKPNDLQLIDGRRITVAEICRLFNVPESMVNSDANKYASNEQNNLHFLQYTLSPVITAIEAGLDKALLLESEKEDGYYFRFDTSEVLRTTEKERMESAAEGLKNGFFSVNETRAKFDKPKLEDDYFMWSLGHVLFNPDTKEMFVPNMQGGGDLDDGPQNMSNSPQPGMPSEKPLPAKQKPTAKDTNKGAKT
jgi:HK97 family phage portal protein